MYRKRSTKLIHIEPIGNWCADLSVTILKWILCFLFVCLLGMNLLFFANLINNAENVEYVNFETGSYCVALAVLKITM